MNSVKEIAITFCASAIITAAVSLIGTNSLAGSLRYVLSLGLICTVLSVAVKGDFSFFYPISNTQTVEYSSNALYEKQAEITVGQILEQNGITFKKITAKATKTEDGSIIINEIEISGCQNGQNAKEVLQKEKIDCKIKVVR